LSVNQNFDGYLWSYDYKEPYVQKYKDKRFKEVNQFATDGTFIEKFKSIAEAGRSTGVYKSSIAKAARNERLTAGGFIFKYLKKEESCYSSSHCFPISNIKEESRYSNTNLSINYSSIYPIYNSIYYTESISTIGNVVNLHNSKGTEELTQQEKQEIYTRYAPLFRKPDNIWIPKRSLTDLSRNVPKKLLNNISKNRSLAIELCLLFLSNLTGTFYTERTKWKQLSSKMLHKQLKYKEDNTYSYPKIINALKIGTKKHGPFIEIKKDKKGKEIYKFNKFTKKFRLSGTYLKRDIVEYQIKEDFLRKRKLDFSFNRIIGAYQNEICYNLLQVYPYITYPSIEEILTEAKRIIKRGKPLKKGKFLTFRNKHSNSHWKNFKRRSFVEDHIKQFKLLTEKGLKIPFPGTAKSGGRVVDSLTLMPSWIRAMCKIKGKRIWEVDYSTLHPNIAMNIYDGSERNINHDEVADYLGISRGEAKIEHLSFFNKHWKQMEDSPLFNYYMNTETEMMKNIKKDKYNSVYKYKITSRKLFKVEVEIMTKAIEELNNMNIYVIYVYDALYCEPRYKYIVKSVMNKVVKEIGVNTYVS